MTSRASGQKTKFKPFDGAAPGLDLEHHAVIEASAGTGKTYSLSHLVARIVREGKATIAQILVVTFTDKATGELLNEVRGALEKTLDAARKEGTSDIEIGRLEQALIDFEQAEVYTIHGFCHRMLQRYAIENREVMDLEVCDDNDVYQAALHRVQTELWPGEFGVHLRAILEAANYADKAKDFDRDVLKIASGLYEYPACPERGDQLVPNPNRLDWLSDEPSHLRQFDKLRGCLRQWNLALSENAGPNDLQAFGDLISGLPLNRVFRDRIPKLLLCVEKAISGDVDLLASHREFCAWAEEAKGTKLMAAVLEQKPPGVISKAKIAGTIDGVKVKAEEKKRAQEVLKRHASSVGKLEQILGEILRIPPFPVQAFKSWTIRAVRREALAWKQQHGLISFDDMLTRLAEALRRDPSDRLHAAVWEAYQYALVDEFQDTDCTQWEILRSVFVEYPERAKRNRVHPLFLIGDPKQAIFAFRGADVETYMTASREILGGQANAWSLNTSYRSSEALLAGLNAIFSWGDEGAGFSPGSGIEYRKVEAANPNELPCRLVEERDHQTRTPVTGVAISGDKIGPVRRQWAAWMADEIHQLLGRDGEGARLVLEQNATRPGSEAEKRDLAPSDICILIRKKSEAPDIERALDGRGIPHAFYKKEGVFQSAESLHLLCALKAIHNPVDRQAQAKLCLTPFVRRPLHEIQAWEGAPASHSLKALVRKWREQATKRQWALFFESLLHESGAMVEPEADALARGDPCPQVDMERRRENYRHITEELELHARRNRCDLSGVIRQLRQLRREKIQAAENANLHRQDSEQSRVQILTMHKSKGLQFPVVFVCGVSGTFPHPAFYRFHEDITATPGQEHTDFRRVVYALDKTNKKAHDEEQQEEDWRLLYVALTRARFRVYVPLGSPRCTTFDLLTPLVRATAGDEATEGVSAVETDVGDEAEASQATSKPSVAASENGVAAANSAGPVQEPDCADLCPPPGIKYGHLQARAQVVTSFSSLVKAGGHQDVVTDTAEDGTPGRRDEEQRRERALGEEAPVDMLVRQGPPPQSLPRGTHLGDIFHDFFELAEYDAISAPADLCDEEHPESQRLRELMKRHGLAERTEDHLWEHGGQSYLQQLAEIIWNTIQAELPLPGDPVRLANLPRNRRRHELEFQLPLPDECDLQKDDLRPAGLRVRGGYVIGYMDLVFQHHRRLYIVDWKSNWLAEGYEQADLKRCMREHDYVLQYQIYTLALQEWLTSRDRQENLEFGGVLYLFVRGMEVGGRGKGVFRAVEPPPGREECLHALAAALGSKAVPAS